LVLGIGSLQDKGPDSRSAEKFSAVAPDAVPPVAANAGRAPPASAEVSDTDRLFRLGHAYRQGTGVPVDDRKAVELFTAAAERGHAAAQYYLGLMYAQGRGVQEELEIAVHWFEQAARQNLVEGQFYLCLSYALGRGVSRDRVTAYAWCRTAEKRGSQDAKESLVEISKLMRRREIKKAEQLAASIAESLGARPPGTAGYPELGPCRKPRALGLLARSRRLDIPTHGNARAGGRPWPRNSSQPRAGMASAPIPACPGRSTRGERASRAGPPNRRGQGL
jgi:TPR repeat protein